MLGLAGLAALTMWDAAESGTLNAWHPPLTMAANRADPRPGVWDNQTCYAKMGLG